MKSTYWKVSLIFLFLGISAATGVMLSSNSSQTPTANAKQLKALNAQSSVSEILDFAATANNRWQTLYVEGHSSVDGKSEPFKTWVRKPDKYRSEEGESVFVKNNRRQLVLWSKQKKAKEHTMPIIPDGIKNQMEARMEIHRAEDPTLAREGELVVDTPVNELINPSYFVRRELKYVAKSVEKVGLTKISGRTAIQLKVVFPKNLAKENYWDVFVDSEVGLLLGLVVHPLPGNPKFETFIDKIEINPEVDDKTFDTGVPAGFVIEKE